MKLNEQFREQLKYMDGVVRVDYAEGKPFKYTNKNKRYKTFVEAQAKNRQTNCVDAVQMGLRAIGIPASSLDWYGGNGKIVWCSSGAKAAAKKYFDIVPTGGKTVQKLYDNMELCDGDILLGYQGISHTSVYYGGMKSFDAGAAEGAVFKKWIKELTQKTRRVNYILRFKDEYRAHYRVQCGAFSTIEEYNKRVALVESKGFQTSQVIEDGMYKVQVGSFSGKTNADRFAAKVAEKKLDVYVKEIP